MRSSKYGMRSSKYTVRNSNMQCAVVNMQCAVWSAQCSVHTESSPNVMRCAVVWTCPYKWCVHDDDVKMFLCKVLGRREGDYIYAVLICMQVGRYHCAVNCRARWVT